jgi:hypothetical protein
MKKADLNVKKRLRLEMRMATLKSCLQIFAMARLFLGNLAGGVLFPSLSY